MKSTKLRLIALLVVVVMLCASFSVGFAPAASGTDGALDLSGQTIDFTILGIGGWVPSSLSIEMSPLFAEYAKENFGYDVNFSFAEAPFDNLFQKAATSLAAQSNEFNLIISDSQWLGALSEPGWIIQLNDIIDANPNLQVDWYSESASKAYMNYPDGSDNIWGLPQEADVLILYVRADLFTDEAERAAFEEAYGYALPADDSVEEWEDIDYVKFGQISEFFTRPDDDLYGTTIQYSKIYDFLTGSFYPFIWSSGGEVWDQETKSVEGVLNTDLNAEMLALDKEFMQYCPPGAIDVDISGIIDNFNAGKAATGFQWAAQGAAMTGPEGSEVWAVIPPGYRNDDESVSRTYSLGGQPWVINAFNTDEQMQVAVDFLNWWYTDETQLEFARRGGNPLGTNVLESDGFDEIQLWFPAYKYMMQEGYSKDFWHEPTYAELLAIQQEAWSAYMAGDDGSVEAAKAVMDDVAAKQQEVLN